MFQLASSTTDRASTGRVGVAPRPQKREQLGGLALRVPEPARQARADACRKHDTVESEGSREITNKHHFVEPRFHHWPRAGMGPSAAGASPEATYQMVRRKCSCMGQCAECREKEETNPRVQMKVAVGPVDDPLELEADRVAEAIMRGAREQFFRHDKAHASACNWSSCATCCDQT